VLGLHALMSFSEAGKRFFAIRIHLDSVFRFVLRFFIVGTFEPVCFEISSCLRYFVFETFPGLSFTRICD